MKELNLPRKIKKNLEDFIERLKDIYGDDLISVILYGSAASSEFTDKRSNINLLAVLNDTSIPNLSKVKNIINKIKFRILHTLFFTEDYIKNSTDVFPIEFLDMKENYLVLHGNDILKELQIDTKNLRFQCEQELKAKLINLKHLYLKIGKDKVALQNLLFKSFTSILHILRNILRLKGKVPPYLKPDILKELGREFQINTNVWEKILAGKNKHIKSGYKDLEDLFICFTTDLEKIVDIVDRL